MMPLPFSIPRRATKLARRATAETDRRKRPVALQLLAVALWLLAAAAGAQTDAATAVANPSPDAAALEDRIAATEGAAGMNDQRRATLLAQYRQALDAVQRTDVVQAEAQAFKDRIENASEQVRQLNELAAEPPEPELPPTDAAETMTLEVLNEQLARRRQALSDERTRLETLETRLRDRANRPAELRTLIADREAKLASLQAQIPGAAPADEALAVSEARQTALEALRRLRQVELAAYRQEDAGHETLMQLLRLERDVAEQRAATLESEVEAWQEATARARRAQAAEVRRMAKDATVTSGRLPAAFVDLARLNVELGSELQSAEQTNETLLERQAKAEDVLNDVEEDLSLARRRAETAGLTKATGLLLREKKNRLPEPENYQLTGAETRDKIVRAATRQIELDGLRRDLAQHREGIEDLLDQAGEMTAAQRRKLRQDMLSILETRRNLIARLQNAYDQQAARWGELDYVYSRITSSVREFNDFAEERLLWIPSLAPLGRTDIGDIARATLRLLRPASWRGMGADVLGALRAAPHRWFIALSACLLLLIGLRRFTRDPDDKRTEWARRRPHSFAGVVRRLLLAAEVSLGPPFVIGLLGYLLADVLDPSDLTQVIGRSLLVAAAIQATLRFVRALLADGAVGATEFEWPEKARRVVRRHLVWLTAVLAPLWGLAYGIPAVADDAVAIRTIGRLFFLPGAAAIAVFVLRAFPLRGAVMAAAIRVERNHWLYSLRYIWKPAAVGAPLLIGLLSIFGYHYTALELGARLIATAWLTLGLIILKHLLLSWLRRTHLAVLFEQAEQERQNLMRMMPQGVTKDPGEDTDEIAITPTEEPEARLAQLNQRARELLRTFLVGAAFVSLWLVWAPVLPFLSSIGEIPIWTNAVADGAPATIRLAHILMAIVAAVVVMSAARHLPYLLELVLLRHMVMEEGTRYAITTLSRYTIIAVGVVLAASLIGVGWGQVQWLVAALGIGLGFGLQEVVANFVSGIIILFERPMRVGDIVTVGEISGKVTRIQIRATTITDWDRKELIVPNKSFITGDLVNWSLSDPILRSRIVVGIAYGSDTRLAEKLLLQAAEENENVLAEPRPRALFLEFGDNSLHFHLLVFLSGVENIFTTRSQLHMAIDDAFRQAGITIAFPQSDTHLDTERPLDIRILRGGSDRAGAKGSDAAAAADAPDSD